MIYDRHLEEKFNNDLLVVTDNGARDLEKKGISGHYVWVGFIHGRGRSSKNMMSKVYNLAHKISQYYKITTKCKAFVDTSFYDRTDLIRVHVNNNELLDDDEFNYLKTIWHE